MTAFRNVSSLACCGVLYINKYPSLMHTFKLKYPDHNCHVARAVDMANFLSICVDQTEDLSDDLIHGETARSLIHKTSGFTERAIFLTQNWQFPKKVGTF